MTTLPDSGFDHVAAFYDPLASLMYGTALHEAQEALLPFVQDNSQVLLIGGGSGWLLEQLCLSGKSLQVLYLDASPKMIRKAQHRFLNIAHNHQVKITFRTGTEAALHPSKQFDHLFTPFLLDLFPAHRLQHLMAKLHSALKLNGTWLFADFWPAAPAPPLRQRLLLKSMYLFFGLVSGVKARALPDYQYQFDQLNLQQVFSETFYGGMVQAKVYRNRQNYTTPAISADPLM